MASLRARLTDIVAEAFARAGYDRSYGVVTVSDRPDLGQFQCNGALAAAKAAKTNPREVAAKVAEHLQPAGPGIVAEAARKLLGLPYPFKDVRIAGPGFINLTLADPFLADHCGQACRDDRKGVPSVESPGTVIVDYGGPNVAKPMHVGHLRAAIIGESIKRIARFLGHNVLGDVHLGDWGLQMGMLIAELRRREPALPYFDLDSEGPYPGESPVTLEDLEELYPAASARAQEDAEAMEAAREATFELQRGRPGYRALWQHFHDVSVAGLRRDYERLGVTFDLWLGESDTQDRIPGMIDRLVQSGEARESEGALVIDVSRPDDKKEMPPLILRKSDGGVLYGTTDMATIDQRVRELGADTMIYVVDNRQSDHFRQVFRAVHHAGIAPEGVQLEHAGFGTMNGKDGKPFKTREGGVMRLNDLMELVTAKARERMTELEMARDYGEEEKERIAHLVGMATLKYADLSNHRAKDYVFDLDRFSSFEGKTGPYVLYTAVRTKSILRKAIDRGLKTGTQQPPATDAERDVMLEIGKLPDVVSAAFEGRAPNHLCEFAYSLATSFNRFYHEHHILSEEDAARQASWLALSACVVGVLELVLELLGIEVPDRM